MVVYISKGFSGEITRMEIDPAATPDGSLDKMVQSIFGSNMEPADFVLFNVTQEFEYTMDQSFSENTKDNDLLLLVNSRSYPQSHS